MPLSLLDRLTDSEVNPATKLHPDSLQYERILMDSMCLDLTGLLNTRRAEQDFDPSFDQATNSLLTFGIADFTALNLTGSVDQEKVRCSVERALRQFEPRLSRVSVSLEEIDAAAPVLRLLIEATLEVGSRRKLVSFNAALHRDSRRMAIVGAA